MNEVYLSDVIAAISENFSEKAAECHEYTAPDEADSLIKGIMEDKYNDRSNLYRYAYGR